MNNVYTPPGGWDAHNNAVAMNRRRAEQRATEAPRVRELHERPAVEPTTTAAPVRRRTTRTRRKSR